LTPTGADREPTGLEYYTEDHEIRKWELTRSRGVWRAGWKKTPSKIPSRASAANPCPDENSLAPWDSRSFFVVCLLQALRAFSREAKELATVLNRLSESSCLARICPFAKPRPVPPHFQTYRCPRAGAPTGSKNRHSERVTPAILSPVGQCNRRRYRRFFHPVLRGGPPLIDRRQKTIVCPTRQVDS